MWKQKKIDFSIVELLVRDEECTRTGQPVYQRTSNAHSPYVFFIIQTSLCGGVRSKFWTCQKLPTGKIWQNGYHLTLDAFTVWGTGRKRMQTDREFYCPLRTRKCYPARCNWDFSKHVNLRCCCARKAVFGVSNHVIPKQACSATYTIYKSKIWPLASFGMLPCNKRITKALIRLGGYAGWSALLLFASLKNIEAHIMT